MKALLSVYDKTGVVEFAQGLREAGFQLMSTGGTHQLLAENGLPAQQVSDVTGFPEILGGRVKTLHPKIHGGILALRNQPEHLSQMEAHGIDPIDLVCVNLYPFVETVKGPQVTLEEALENIDIGGPAMLRAAAKNFPSVIVVVDPADYSWIMDRLRNGGVSREERRGLAHKAFQHVALYDATIARYLGSQGQEDEALPDSLVVAVEKGWDLRYGENPHQRAALYLSPLERGGMAGAQQLHGKELSYNNILDVDAAWEAVSDFEVCTVTVVKHNNSCGLACHADLAEAYRRAYAGDPISAFGGVVACNRPVTVEAAQEMAQVFYEIIVAPEFEPQALEALRKKRNLRLLALGSAERESRTIQLRQVAGGVLAQTPDIGEDDPTTWRTVTQRHPTAEEQRDLAFAWKAVKHIKSNAIVLAREEAMVGMGAGQPNRVVSVRLAAQVAGQRAHGSVLASDAFFPFTDGVEAAAEAGVTAVVQPGGSLRDQELIDAADRLGIAMLFTGVRHFKH